MTYQSSCLATLVLTLASAGFWLPASLALFSSRMAETAIAIVGPIPTGFLLKRLIGDKNPRLHLFQYISIVHVTAGLVGLASVLGAEFGGPKNSIVAFSIVVWSAVVSVFVPRIVIHGFLDKHFIVRGLTYILIIGCVVFPMVWFQLYALGAVCLFIC